MKGERMLTLEEFKKRVRSYAEASGLSLREATLELQGNRQLLLSDEPADVVNLCEEDDGMVLTDEHGSKVLATDFGDEMKARRKSNG